MSYWEDQPKILTVRPERSEVRTKRTRGRHSPSRVPSKGEIYYTAQSFEGFSQLSENEQMCKIVRSIKNFLSFFKQENSTISFCYFYGICKPFRLPASFSLDFSTRDHSGQYPVQRLENIDPALERAYWLVFVIGPLTA